MNRTSRLLTFACLAFFTAPLWAERAAQSPAAPAPKPVAPEAPRPAYGDQLLFDNKDVLHGTFG